MLDAFFTLVLAKQKFGLGTCLILNLILGLKFNLLSWTFKRSYRNCLIACVL